jgi:hypothetical protein
MSIVTPERRIAVISRALRILQSASKRYYEKWFEEATKADSE